MKPDRATPRRVVGYVRISKDRADETSTETQRERIEAYCTSQGWQIVDVIVEAGRSAYKASRSSRPGFKRAMQIIASGAANTIVVWKIDRAARNTRDLLELVDDLTARNARFVSVTEQFDTESATGRMTLTILSAVAEMESAQKSERTTAWHDHRKTTAAVPNGSPPRGYRKPAPNVLEVDPVEARLIRQAIADVLDGRSLRSVRLELNRAGINISQQGLTVLFRSPTIAGLRSLGDGVYVEGSWSALVDRDTWDRLGKLLDDPRRNLNTSAGKRRWALAGIARCHCGGRMRSLVNKTRPTRLLCLECSQSIQYQPVEDLVTAAVLDALDDDVWRGMRSANGSGATVDVEAELAKLWELVLDRTIGVDDYRAAKLRWEGEQVAARTPSANLPDVASVRKAWQSFTAEDRHLVFTAVIESLVIGAARRCGRGVQSERISLDLV